MIKKLRVTVDGKSYDVTVEMPDDAASPVAAPSAAVIAPSAPPPASAPVAPVARPSAGGPGAVTSPLAGRVIAILVTPGQAVKAGDQLLTIEAMKMNTAVNAPSAGKVVEILATVGAAVDEGALLARIEEAK